MAAKPVAKTEPVTSSKPATTAKAAAPTAPKVAPRQSATALPQESVVVDRKTGEKKLAAEPVERTDARGQIAQLREFAAPPAPAPVKAEDRGVGARQADDRKADDRRPDPWILATPALRGADAAKETLSAKAEPAPKPADPIKPADTPKPADAVKPADAKPVKAPAKAAVDPRLEDLAKKAGGPQADAGRAAYDARVASELEAKGMKVEEITHSAGYTVYETNQGELRIQYGSGDVKGAVKTAEELAKDGKGSIIDTGSMTPQKVKELEASLETRKRELVEEKARLEQRRAGLDAKDPATELERKRLKFDQQKLAREERELTAKAEGLERVHLHNPFSPEIQALATKHGLAFDEASSLHDTLGRLGLDPKTVKPEEVVVGEDAIAKHFGLKPGEKQLPELMVKGPDGKFHAAELKNTAAPGSAHTGSVSDVEHTVKKFNDLSEQIEKKYGQDAIGGFELHARPGASLGEDFTVGANGELLKDGKPAGQAPIKVVGKDLPPTDGAIKNPKAFTAGPGEAAAGRVPAAEPRAKGGATELPRTKQSELALGEPLGSGAHSTAYKLGDDEAAIIFKKDARGAESAAHLEEQLKYMQGLKDVTFEGQGIAPGIKRVITDADGKAIGYVTERIGGEELGKLVERGALTDAQFAEVGRQLRGQMEALHDAGHIHGDANLGNIMVDVGKDGRVKARLLDFEKPTSGFGAAEDKALLERTLGTAGDMRKPENVAKLMAKEEEKRLIEVQKKFVGEETKRAEELRGQVKDLRKALPEAAEADREFLTDLQRTLGMDGKESRLWKHEDFAAAQKKLTDLNAVERLKNMDLSKAGPEAQRMRDELLKQVEDVHKGWGVLKNAKDPETAKALLSTLEKAAPAEREALAATLKAVEPEKLGRLLAQNIGDRPAAEVLGKVLKSLPEESRATLGKMLSHLEPEAASTLLKIAEHADGKLLGTALSGLEKATAHDPQLVGKGLQVMEEMVGKMGLKMTGEVAGKVLHGLVKILPIAGAAAAGYSTYEMGKIALDGSLPPEIRFLGGVGAALNGTDAALMVAEAFGVGAPGIPVSIALGVGELGLDLYVTHLMDLHKEGKFKSSPELDAIIAGSGLAMGPSGVAMMVGMFGGSETERKMINLGRVGSKLAVDAAVKGGMLGADVTGGQLKMTAKGIDTMADMIRNPEKYAEAAKQLGLKAVDLGKKGLDGLIDLSNKAGELGKQAVTALGDTATYLKGKGFEGLETLKWMSQNPGAAARIAKDKMVELAVAGGALGKKAYDGLVELGKDGVESVKTLVGELQKKGAEAVETLKYIAQNPGAAGEQAIKWAVSGMRNLVDQGGEAAKKAVRGLMDFANEQGKIGQEAVEALVDAMRYAKNADWSALADAWGRNLTEGGKAVMRSLANLGDAGAEAFGTMSRAIWDHTPDWATARKLLESFGGNVTQKLVNAIGSERLAGLIDSAGTSVEWIRTQLAGAFDADRWRELGTMLQRTSLDGLRKLQDVFGPKRIAQTLRSMRDAGIEYGDRLVQNARNLGSRAVEEAMGLVDRVAPVNDQGYRGLPDGRVPPWDPRAEWVFGIQNPFR